MTWLKQNWIKVGILIAVSSLGYSFYYNCTPSQQIDNKASIANPETIKPTSTQFIDPTKDCVAYYKNRAISPKSQDLNLVAEIERKPEGEVSLLLIRSNMGKVLDFKGSTIPMYDPVFSLDKKKVYYRKHYAEWSTAIYEYNLETEQERFITDGESFMIIPKGIHKDNLIVEKLKHFYDEKIMMGYSEDQFWMVNPKTGKEIGKQIISIDDFFNTFVCD